MLLSSHDLSRKWVSGSEGVTVTFLRFRDVVVFFSEGSTLYVVPVCVYSLINNQVKYYT